MLTLCIYCVIKVSFLGYLEWIKIRLNGALEFSSVGALDLIRAKNYRFYVDLDGRLVSRADYAG